MPTGEHQSDVTSWPYCWAAVLLGSCTAGHPARCELSRAHGVADRRPSTAVGLGSKARPGDQIAVTVNVLSTRV
jgi:hypothetical protein